jgi:hypothetical protein
LLAAFSRKFEEDLETYPLQIRGRIFQPEKYTTILSYSCEVEPVLQACFSNLAKFLNIHHK